jgi:hypothetical protein
VLLTWAITDFRKSAKLSMVASVKESEANHKSSMSAGEQERKESKDCSEW